MNIILEVINRKNCY